MQDRKLSLQKPRWRRVAAGIAILALTLAIALCITHRLSAKDRTWERIRSQGVIRVGLDASFPPFEAVNPATNEIVGLDIDLAHAFGEELGGIRPEIVNVGYDGLYDSLMAGRFDIILSALPVDYTRTEDIHYSPAYFEAGLVLVTRRVLTSEIAGASDLAGRKVAIEWGSEGDAYGRQLARRQSGLTLLSYETPADALSAVAQGDADAALVDAISAHEFMREHQGLAIVGPPLTQASYAIAVRKSSPILAKNIDRALLQLQANGALEAIMRKWL